MKNFQPAFLLLLLVFLLDSCAYHKKCNEPITDSKSTQKFYSKRYKNALTERDSLCNLALLLQKDTTLVKSSLRKLQDEYKMQGASFNNLDDQFRKQGVALDNLKKSTKEELNKLSAELSQKENDLAAKQKALADKEKRLTELESLIKQRDDMLNNILGTLRNTLTAFPKDELSMVMKNGKIYVSLLDKLLFKSGSPVVEPRGVDALKQLAPILKSNPDLEIVIEGHTDNVPIKTAIFKDNWDLSTYRATSVLRILLDDQLEKRRLTASGKGEFSPVASNDTPEGKSQNRRTEIILSPNLDALFKLLEK